MNPPKIDSYHFGKIVIDGQAYDKDLIIAPHGVTPNWWRAEGHSLAMGDLEVVLEAPPEVLVIGQGAYGYMKLPDSIRQELESAGMEVLVQRTAEACQTYNRLLVDRQVIAALHLTC
jgi:hypothetical protein